MDDLTGIHHIGLLVRDMDDALAAYARLGFHLGPPAYPALPPAPGAAPEPVGAGNTHADFPRSFIELLAFAPADPARLPAGAALVPLQVPDDQLAATRTVIGRTLDGLAARLDRAEGAHILVLTTDDAERTAARLDAAAVPNSGARTAQRPLATAAGTVLADVRFLKLHDPAAPGGLVPEGRVGAAEDAPADLLDAQTGLAHPNGANAITACTVCTAPDGLDAAADRYRRYLGTAPESDGPDAVFTLGAARLVLTTPAALAHRLPGERPRTLPGIAACTLAVTDLPAAERLLRANGVPLGRTADGDPFVPAAAALGLALVLKTA
ncbi:VOC family protein [Glycomyces terrestris]|uniref:VOC family protein n=1 Tax=Glycomyces terrestris TaxID=2493553 RepID=A0A426UV54_9ACTN|nr:VOC family protein [Glycomyces terrestris]RRR98225.1 VOC family protein [Glycomyces terrestris]